MRPRLVNILSGHVRRKLSVEKSSGQNLRLF